MAVLWQTVALALSFTVAHTAKYKDNDKVNSLTSLLEQFYLDHFFIDALAPSIVL